MTQKPVLRSIEEFMGGYTPVYQPLYPLLLGKSQSYSEEVGEQKFRRVETVGDIRGHHFLPKDSEWRNISVGEFKKTFKKYFLGNQLILSNLQDGEGMEDVKAQALDEHQVQMDELVLFGEGSSNSTMINNGLYYSSDPNYIHEDSVEVAATKRLYDLHAKVIQSATKADLVAGRKAVVFYGTDILPVFDSLYDTAVKPFKTALGEVLGSNYSLVKMPAPVTPSSANGWMIVNLDQVKLHYTSLPTLKNQGSNDEKMYNWFNFLMGSTMVEVLAEGGVIRQPCTLE